MKHALKRPSILLVLLCALILAAYPFASVIGMAAPTTLQTPLRLGDSGDDVLQLQRRLAELGYYSQTPTGVFDDATLEAVRAFARDNHLADDGVCGWEMWALLFGAGATLEAEVEENANFPPPMASYDLAPGTSPVMEATRVSWSYAPGESFNTNEYNVVSENTFLAVGSNPFSTFAADVDTASYAQIRSQILAGNPVTAASVRIEEMLNYFAYDYAQPNADEPFGVTMEVSDCPWNPDTKLLLMGLQAKAIVQEARPTQNLVFLIDVSGSMDAPNKLPLVKRAFLLLLDALDPADTISIVTYASNDAVLMDGEKAANKVKIMETIENLFAGGSTAGAAGIKTAYELAKKHYIRNGVNRVLLATDGDLNVGISSEGELVAFIEEEKQSGVFLSVLGFGDGNLKDNKLEALADHGDGNYSYIDTVFEARRALVEEIGATFQTVAKDVKLQVEFNPAKIKGYRLIGYENRLMADADFADDTKDGGEVGSGHRVTVLYEIVPVGSAFEIAEIETKYTTTVAASDSDEWLTLNLRAKEPDGDESKLYSYPLNGDALSDSPSDNLLFAAAVAQTGMLLTDSEWKGTATYQSTLALLRQCESVRGDAYKEEFLYLLTLLDRQQ